MLATLPCFSPPFVRGINGAKYWLKLSDGTPNRQRRLRSIATLMSETSHRLEGPSSQAGNEVSRENDSLLDSSTCFATRVRFSDEMLLTSSKRGVRTPERRWTKAWTNRVQQGFKVSLFNLIDMSWSTNGPKWLCPLWSNISLLLLWRLLAHALSWHSSWAQNNRLVLRRSKFPSWPSSSPSVSEPYLITAFFSLIRINPLSSSQLTPHHLGNATKHSIIWIAGGPVSSLNCSSSPLL